jgi:hypothetical protein
VLLSVEPVTDGVDQYGRLLRYVVRAKDHLNVNIRLVAVGAAAPYFYRGRRGRYAGCSTAWRGAHARLIAVSGVNVRGRPTIPTTPSRRIARTRDHPL